jgi:glyoxylase-like metal-dependent hydrolase (beta-lactamase superfamily II)
MLDGGWMTASAALWRRDEDPEERARVPVPSYLVETDSERILIDTRIVLTHLHFDHAGGLSLLPASIPIVVQRREWEAGGDRGAIERNFFHPRDYLDDEREVVLVDGDHDLLGDGSIELLLTPGHTPGHQSVRLGEDLIVGADVSHYASGLDDHRFPAFGDDLAEQRRSAERLRALRDGGARVTPGHDPDVLRPGPVGT